MIPIEHEIRELQADIDAVYAKMNSDAIFTALALSTLSNVICRLERHVALQGLRFPDGFGHSYVIPGRAYASFNPETLVWLDEMVGPENYVIFADIFGISFRYEQDAFAFRLRWS